MTVNNDWQFFLSTPLVGDSQPWRICFISCVMWPSIHIMWAKMKASVQRQIQHFILGVQLCHRARSLSYSQFRSYLIPGKLRFKGLCVCCIYIAIGLGVGWHDPILRGGSGLQIGCVVLNPHLESQLVHIQLIQCGGPGWCVRNITT